MTRLRAIRAALMRPATGDVDPTRLAMGLCLASFLSAAITMWSLAHPHIVVVVS